MFRLVPLDDGEAQAGARVVIGLGIVLALALLFSRLTEHWDLSTTTQTALQFPLVLFGAAGLWRAARLIDVARQRLAGPADAGASTMRSRFFRILRAGGSGRWRWPRRCWRWRASSPPRASSSCAAPRRSG